METNEGTREIARLIEEHEQNSALARGGGTKNLAKPLPRANAWDVNSEQGSAHAVAVAPLKSRSSSSNPLACAEPRKKQKEIPSMK